MPFAFHDLPAYAFPVRVELIDIENGATLHTIDIPGPGVIEIPSVYPRTCWVRMTLGNGEVVEQRPPDRGRCQ